MGRKAKPLQEQVDLLIKRGMRFDEPERARQFLLEIGWYRMSLYWFPFETRYPDERSVEHRFREGTDFRDALLLYAFDFNLRNKLLKPLERIETAFRTFLIYQVSTRYPDSPTWFADTRVVTPAHARAFERTVYQPMRRQNPHIQLHHRRFPADRFAPAWKTLEFVTLGTICNLYSSLTSQHLRQEIARHFGVAQEDVFADYMGVIRGLRNNCAHGNVLYDFRPGEIPLGPALNGTHAPRSNLAGAISVVEHFLKVISERLLQEFRKDLSDLLHEFAVSRGTRHVLGDIAGFKLPSDRKGHR